MTGLGLVVIGRNEGDRLVNCLRSIGARPNIVYVDSGSSDGSIASASAYGARIVELDMARPFTAARARNAGREALGRDCKFIQFIDGDCALQPGWLETASAALNAEPHIGAVFGRRREVAPQASRYNWMCDNEWDHPPGPARYFGGDVMLRVAALDAALGYPDEMIAGEEPDLAMRMRSAGWAIACLPAEMTLHDAAITRFGQWWRRATRSGHAYAELARRHRGTYDDYGQRLKRAVFWGAILPLSAIASSISGAALARPWLVVAGGGISCLPLVQMARLTLRGKRRYGPKDAFTIAFFQMVAKPAQSLGAARFLLSQISGNRPMLIEYKDRGI